MNKNSIIIAVAIVMVALLGYFSLRTEKNDNQFFKIGALLPLSGDFAALGEEVNKGAILAVEEAKVNGFNVSYISEDDALNPARGVAGASKLIKIDRVDAAFTMVGEEAKPTAPIFEKAETPLLITWDSNQDLQKLGKYIFSIGFSSEKNGVLVANFARNSLDLGKMVVVEVVDPIAEVLANSFVERFAALNGNLLSREKIQPSSQDHRSVIAKIKSLNPTGLYIILFPPQHISFLKQIREIGYKGEIIAADSFIQSEIDGSGGAAEGVYFAKTFAEKPGEILELYKNRFGNEPSDPTLVSFGYDGAMTLIEAHKIAKERNLSIRDGLTLVKFQGLGTAVDMKGSQFSDRVEKMYKIKDGKSILAE